MFITLTDSDVKRFWAKVQKTKTCWLWTGGICKGYGHFWLNGKTVKAHQVSYVLSTGKQVENCTLHTCDNPPCVNPDHLSEGTFAENNRQRNERGRSVNNFKSGSEHRCAKLNHRQVRQIRDDPESNIKVAQKYGINASTVSRIRQRKIWVNV